MGQKFFVENQDQKNWGAVGVWSHMGAEPNSEDNKRSRATSRVWLYTWGWAVNGPQGAISGLQPRPQQ
jgi:hypothetical protein